jgi:hypothetical protein
MPLSITTTAGGTNYASPFVGPVNHTLHVKVDISGLTNAEIDSSGYLKPGVPLTSAGVLVTTGVAVYGVTVEAVKILADNASGTIAAGTDCFVAIATHGIVNRDIAEDNLARAYTSDEIAGFALAGSTLKLTTT